MINTDASGYSGEDQKKKKSDERQARCRVASWEPIQIKPLLDKGKEENEGFKKTRRSKGGRRINAPSTFRPKLPVPLSQGELAARISISTDVKKDTSKGKAIPLYRWTLQGPHCCGISFALGHPVDEHVVQLGGHLFEPFAFLLEQAAGDRVVRASRGDVRFVMDNNKQVTNIVLFVEV